MTTFGKETVGGSTINLSVGKLSVNAFTKAKAGKITKLTVHIAEGGNTGTAKMKAIVYADDGTGRPGAELSEGTEVTYKNGDGTKSLDLPLPGEPDATGARVHIGIKLGGTPNVAQFVYDATGGEHDHTFKEWTYTTAAPTLWSEGEGGGETHKGVGGFDTSIFTIYATYTADAPSVTKPPEQINTVGIPINELWVEGLNIESWSATGLPTGLSIAAGTGHVSGTPSATESVTVTLKGKGESSTDEKTFTWKIQSVAEVKSYKGYTAFSPLPGTLGKAESAFNQTVAGVAIAPNSAGIVKWLLETNTGGMGVAHTANQYPTVFARDTDPQIEIVRRGSEPSKEPNGFFHTKTIRIPAAAKCQRNSDKHLQVVLCPKDCTELSLPEGTTCDIWQCNVNSEGHGEDPQETIIYEGGGTKLKVSSCGKGNLTGSLAPPPGGASVAANYDLGAGIIRGAELKARDIKHALVMLVSDVAKSTHVYPANHTDGSSLNPNAPPMGQRFKLEMSDAEIDAAGLPHPYLVAVAKAFAHYGGYLEDTGGTHISFRTENDNMFTAFGAPGYFARSMAAEGQASDSEGVLLDYSPLLPLVESHMRAIAVPTEEGAVLPTITKPADQVVPVDLPMTLEVIATAVTTFSARDLPSGLRINTATGEISGTPRVAVAGNVTIVATGSTSVETTFRLAVEPQSFADRLIEHLAPWTT